MLLNVFMIGLLNVAWVLFNTYKLHRMRHLIIYLLYLCSRLDLGLFISYLCDVFHFRLYFHYDYSCNLLNLMSIFTYFLENVSLFLDDNLDEESE